MKTIGTIILALFLVCNIAISQDTLYVYKTGTVVSKRAVIDIDSVTFYKNYKTPNPETVTDIDGNVYHTVKIGTQTWMVENLKTTKYRNGESILNITDASSWGTGMTGKWSDYGNSSTYSIRFGHFYNGWAVKDSRNIAPSGWHVPTDAEWTTLENYLIANGYNYDGTKTGDKFYKSLAANTNWFTYSVIGTIGNDLSKNNSTGFNALPGGYRDSNGNFSLQGSNGYFWSSTSFIPSIGTCLYARVLSYDGMLTFKTYLNYSSSSSNYDYGLSVRCIKD